MYTSDEFKAEWQKRHHPTMDLSSDVSFYYDVYRHLHGIAENSASHLDNAYLITLAMYIENNATIGLDPIYESLYGSIADLVWHWCHALGVSSEDYSRMYSYTTDAVAAAPAGSLRQWVAKNVLSRDFNRLKEVALFFARQDMTLRQLYPTLSHRKGMYMKLTSNDMILSDDMLWSDMAFNWYDKTGMSLLHRLAGRFHHPKDDKKLAANLITVSSKRLDAYLPLENRGNRILTLETKDGRIFKDVVSSTLLPKDLRKHCFICQLVSYLGTIYVNGPGLWYDRKVYDRWNSNMLWHGIYEGEKEDAMNRYFTSPLGMKYSLYQDIYGDDKDIDRENPTSTVKDKPNVIDFLYWLAPEKSQAKEKV